MKAGTSATNGRTSDRRAPGKRVFAGNMWAIYNYDDPNKRYRRFLERGRPRFTQLIDGLLMYDEVVIPTQDFLSVTVLVGVLGERAVIDLLEAGDLSFLRMRGAFAYVGNGGGLKTFKIDNECFADDQRALAWALSGLEPRPKDPALPQSVLEKTTSVNAFDVLDAVKHETYMDVLHSPYIRNLFAIRSKHMDRLAGIQPNEVRCYGGPDADSWRGDEIDMLMHLAAANVELRLSETVKCEDGITLNPIGHLLKAKTERSIGSGTPYDSLARLTELNRIPDIASFVLDKPASTRAEQLSKIMRLKRSRDGAAFRRWFHANCRENPQEVAKRYVDLLKQVPTVSKLPVRILRFLAVLGLIPVLGPVLGLAASALDSFVVDRWFRGHSPKFFIENLKQVIAK